MASPPEKSAIRTSLFVVAFTERLKWVDWLPGICRRIMLFLLLLLEKSSSKNSRSGHKQKLTNLHPTSVAALAGHAWSTPSFVGLPNELASVWGGGAAVIRSTLSDLTGFI
jgi:hypothetical protein